MKISKMKKSDRAVLQILAVLGIIDMACKTHKKAPLLGLLAVPFIGAGLEAKKEDNGFRISVDTRLDDSRENVIV